MRVVLLSPRGMCAGVRRAIATVEGALDRHGAPIYVLGQIVHNHHVVARLAARGVIFTETLEQLPRGARVILSAHGVAPAVRDETTRRGLLPIDASCPLVARIHREVQRAADRGELIVLIGEPDHEEVIGTVGHAPAAIAVVAPSAEAAEALAVPGEAPIRLFSQTTLSTDAVVAVVAVLVRRFGARIVDATANICYATRDRQQAVRRARDAGRIERLLVVGSLGSSNSRRLVDVARATGLEAALIEDADAIEPAWLEGTDAVGLTAGASTPEDVVEAVIARLAELGAEAVEELDPPAGARAEVSFALPRQLDQPSGDESEDEEPDR